jgi:hypothetical protein
MPSPRLTHPVFRFTVQGLCGVIHMLLSAVQAALATVARGIAVSILLLGVGIPAFAQEQPTAPPRPSELIGAKVFTGDGSPVGEIAAVSVGPDGMVSEMRMNAPSPLGLGQRTVVLPLQSVIVLEGAVVLDLSPSEVDALPSASVGSASADPNQL